MKQIKATEFITEPNIGNRFFAGFIDYLIIYGFTFYLIITIGEPNGEGGYSLNGAPALLPVLFWGIMTVGIEQFFGATLGNLFVGLKPVSIQKSHDNLTFNATNEKLTFWQSLKRHLLDPIDMFFLGLVGIVTIKKLTKIKD